MVYKQGEVQLVKAPADTKELLKLRKKLNLEVSIAQFKEMVKNLPCTVIDKMTDRQFDQLLMKEPELLDYLLFLPNREVDTGFGAWCAYKGAAEQRKKAAKADKTITEPEINIADPLDFVRLARLLTGGDMSVMNEIDYADIGSASNFFHMHKQSFAERGIDTMSDLAAYDSGKIWLLGLVDILIKHDYACELDWKADIEEFVWAVEQLFIVRAMSLPVNSFGLFEDDDVELWLTELNKNWQTLNFCLLQVDINSDSYVLVPCLLHVLDKVMDTAAKSHILNLWQSGVILKPWQSGVRTK